MKFRVIQPRLPGFQSTLPHLYEDAQFSGYDGMDLQDWLEENYGLDKVNHFNKWMNGQTMAIHVDGMGYSHGIVYQWDFERYMHGLPVID